MKYTFPFLTILSLPLITCVFGQTKSVNYNLFELNRKGQLEVFNRTIKAIDKNEKVINILEKTGDGVVWLKDKIFSNGTIEVDIKGNDVIQKSFVGIAFHGQDEKTLDAVYFRPFNFKANDSVRRNHAIQYVSHPLYIWDKLREEKNGVYEKAVSPAPNPNNWFHAKIIIHYPNIKVFVDGNLKPSLSIDQLNNRKTGKVGLWVGNNSGGSFVNLKIYNEQ